MRMGYIFTLILIATLYFPGLCSANHIDNVKQFDVEKDLLIMQFDCKTDVDDIHSAAALKTLLSDSRFSAINYYAVAGTYGIQEGLYVSPNELFQLAFGDKWADAHANRKNAVEEMKNIILACLQNGGNVWIAEAGQSDFSAELIKSIQKAASDIQTKQCINIVQHSDWNEEVTSAESLAFVKANSKYHKIPDGNVVGNGTPGFRAPDCNNWKTKLQNPELIYLWRLAVGIGLKYNGKDDRYNNEAVASCGLDFSDLCEVCWILGLEDIADADQFFTMFGK